MLHNAPGIDLRARSGFPRSRINSHLQNSCSAILADNSSMAQPGLAVPLLAAGLAIPPVPGNGVADLLTNRVFLVGFWSWFSAQFLKVRCPWVLRQPSALAAPCRSHRWPWSGTSLPTCAAG